jgi:acetyl-CoA carboxylase biotin carboxylase subunit
VPGTEDAVGPDVPDGAIRSIADAVGYPLMVKAVAGGGGKGLRMVADSRELASAVRAARSEAGSAFGDSAIYLERRLSRPRHVEVQVLGDSRGRVLPFVERECSIQRRHQKVVEETPSPVVSPELRGRMAAAATAVAESVGYTNAGTVEFLVDEGRAFYFLEMNTRLQVEHPVTEMVTGVDLVEWQLRIARGEPLTLDASEALTPRGHAIECRVYAEDPDTGFLPSPGRITALRVPSGPGIRDDGGTEAGADVPPFYDPLISKLVAWGSSRPQSIARMRRALAEYDVRGIRTTVGFFRWLLEQPAFVAGEFHTGFLDELLHTRVGEPFLKAEASYEEVAAIAAALLTSVRPSSASGGNSGGTSAGAGSLRGWTSAARRESLR